MQHTAGHTEHTKQFIAASKCNPLDFLSKHFPGLQELCRALRAVHVVSTTAPVCSLELISWINKSLRFGY